MIRIIFVFFFVAVDSMIIFFAPSNNFSRVNFFPFRFRYLQENAIEELPNEGFNGLSRLKIV